MKFTKTPFLWAALIWAVSTGSGWAQPQPLRLNADYACFRYDDRAVFVEVFYSVKGAPQSGMGLTVFRNDSVWTENAWTNTGADSAREGDTVLGRVYFVAPEGRYRWRLSARDGASNLRRDSVLFHQSIQPFSNERLELSDIELASSIQFASEASAGSPFFKNGMIILPNPTLQFGSRQNLLYFYVELYNVLTGIEGERYVTRVSVLNENRTPVPEIKPISRKKMKTHGSIMDFGEIGLFGLGSGKYILSYAVLDSAGRVLSEKQKPFWMVRPPEAVFAVQPEPQFESSPFSAMDEGTMKEEYECVKYLMDAQQRKLFSSIKNLDSRRRWMYDFWRTAPAIHSVNFEEYHRRIDEANALYGTLQMAGWKTDRGRVFMAYGKPSDIDRFPSSSQMVPYEIWSYDAIEGGVIFVFADLSGFKNYSLLHSTKRGEVYNPEYEAQLKSGY